MKVDNKDVNNKNFDNSTNDYSVNTVNVTIEELIDNIRIKIQDTLKEKARKTSQYN